MTAGQPSRSHDGEGADDSSVLLRRPGDAAEDKSSLHSSSHGRMFGKTGATQIVLLNVPNRNRRFMQDLFNTLVECRWRYTLLMFLLSHFVSWFLFAVVWYVMSAVHGDFDDPLQENHSPCLLNVLDFTSAFIFSMESQTTIGYGTAYPSRDCPQAVVVLCFQSVCGMIIEAFSVGIVFAKLSRPHMRGQTLLFSEKAVIAVRNKCLTLQFRIGDLRKSQLVNTKLWVVIRGLSDGDENSLDQVDLPVTFDGESQKLSTMLPTTVMHRIDENSPLYTMDPRELLTERFEILVYLEGTIQSTGQTTQARTSYIPSEIMWGHRFYPMLRSQTDFTFTPPKGINDNPIYFARHCSKHRRYEVDYNRFHETVEVETPLCSAADLNRVRRLSEMNMLVPIKENREETAIAVDTDA